MFSSIAQDFIKDFLYISSEFSEENIVLAEFSLMFLSFHVVDDRGKKAIQS